jgi:hypothetical protein
VLQAITRRKAESFLKGDSAKAPREDIMTDAVFGGLRYFDARTSGLALQWMMPGVISHGSSVREIRLWEMRNRVEPDVLIDMESAAGQPYRIIIEAKWLDNVLSAAQLDAQWREFGPGTVGCHGEVFHILLVQRRIRVELAAYQLAPDALRRRRHLITWRDLAAAAGHRKLIDGTPQIHLWMRDVIRVIDLGEGTAFTGWSVTPACGRPSELLPVCLVAGPGVFDHPARDI